MRCTVAMPVRHNAQAQHFLLCQDAWLLMRIFNLLAFFLLVTMALFSCCAHSQSGISFEIQGVKGQLKDNIEIYLQRFYGADYTPSIRFHAELEQEIQTALQALGYYHASIQIEQYEQTAHNISITIHAGEPVRIAKADIVINGEAAEDNDFKQLLQLNAPKSGDILHQGQYDGLKAALRNLALRKGYFDADFAAAELAVAPELNQAFVTLHYTSGERYHFGKISFEGSQIEIDRLHALLPFTADSPYLASNLGELNQALASTGWFSSILIEGDVDNIQQGQLPIVVQLAPEKKNIVETGIGFSTDVGPRLKLNWLKPWLNSAGHSLRADTALSDIEQSIEAAYKLPLRSVSDFYQLQLGFRNRDNEDTRSRESNLVLERHWLLADNWYRTASVRWLYEDFVQADQRDNISLIMPGLSYNRSRQSAGAMPMSADRLSLRMEISDEAWGSDTSFIRLRGRAGWIGSLGDNHRLVSRLDGGAILMEAVVNLPPSLRFFAGGDNSIRGYGYETVAPRNNDDELIGGRYMAVASAEYQYRVSGNWWLALFTDYGSAWNDQPQWVQGIGTGLRWASPVGPLRLDFAYGLDQPGGGFQLHFALGPEL